MNWDFDWQIDEFMVYCRSKQLREKSMLSYEQGLRLFQRWCAEQMNITEVDKVTESVIRRYISDILERGKYTFYADENQKETNHPDRRRDYRNQVSVVTVNSYIRRLRVFFNWLYIEGELPKNPMKRIRQLKENRKAKEYIKDEDFKKLIKNQKKVLCESGVVPIYGTGGLMGYASDFLYDKPSVLIGRKGSIDKVRYVDHPFWTVDTLFYTVINDAIVIPKYLFYALSLIDFLQLNEGTTIPSLRTETLNRLELNIPDLPDQEKILSILNSIDDKIELNNRINKNLEQQLRVVFEKWFVSGAEDLWEEKRIGDFLRLDRGLSYKGKFLSENEGVPMLNLGNILPNSVFRPEKLKFYTGEYKRKRRDALHSFPPPASMNSHSARRTADPRARKGPKRPLGWYRQSVSARYAFECSSVIKVVS